MQDHYEAYWNRDNPPPNDDPLAETRAALLFELMDKLATPPQIFIDIGCGSGWLVGSAQSRGMEATGLDISKAVIERAQALYPEATFKQAELGRDPLPVEPATFDIASSFEVIEHLLDPAALISAMRDVLRTGGHAAITTPYHGVAKNIAIALKGFDKHYAVTGDHIRFFSDRALRSLLESNGFRVVETKHFGRAPLIWAGVLFWAQKI